MPMSDMQEHIYIVEDEPEVRESTTWLLESSGYSVFPMEDASHFFDTLDRSHPGCAVLDIHVPGMDGLTLQATLNERGIDLPIIFITAYGDVPAVKKALKAGAHDFIEKPYKPREILDAVESALAADRQRLQAHTTASHYRELLDRLTGREREIAHHLVQGCSNAAIAERLGLSAKTVENHRGRLMKKLEAQSTAHLLSLLFDIKSHLPLTESESS